MPDRAKRRAADPRDVIERRAGLILSHRFVVLSISATLLVMAFACAIVMRIVDSGDFPTVGIAMWWAVSTFTTVGYGDVVPTTAVGRVVGGILMVIGIMFLSFLTAAVTTTLIRRDEAAPRSDPEDAQAILDGISRLEQRLEQLEAKLGG